MRRAFAFAAVLALGVAAVASAPSCSTETVATIDTGCPVSGTTPSISIASPADGACIEVGAGSDAFIPVVVALENFKLDPPGACAECQECGHIALDVNGQPNNSSANAVVDMVFGGNIASHYGEFELTVTLVGDDGTPWVAPVDGGTSSSADAGDAGTTTAAKPIRATVKITTAKSCATSSSSSSSGTGGADAGSSSSSSSSGTGGAGTGGAGTGGAGTGGSGGGMSSSSSSGTGGAGTGGAGTGGAGTGGAGTGGKTP